MTEQGGLQGGKQRQALLAQGGQVAANASKGLCACKGAAATGDLLLDLDHPKISLSLVVGPSRQLHRLHLWRKECLRLLIPFILCTASSLRSSTIATIGENIVSFFTRPLS